MTERVTDYLEGALSARSRLGVRWHLLLCPACGRYFRQMRQTIALLGEGPPPPKAPDSVADAVIESLRQHRAGRAAGD
jgi:anti-sigma factor RsiW